MATAVMFMLIGCSNVANLLLARGVARQREISVRLAIGAGHARIVRQLLTESCVLAILGGAAAYALVAAAWTILPAVVPVSIPRLAAARADWTVLAFTLTTAAINGVLFGIAPALRAAARRGSISFSGFGTRGSPDVPRDRIRSALVVAQVAVAMILVVIGGELLGSFVRLLGSDKGFEAEGVVTSVVLPLGHKYKTPEQRELLYERILESVRALPGVESAGTTDALPFSGENHSGFVSASEADVMRPGGQFPAEIDVVSHAYLPTMRARLLEGRWFRPEEMASASNVAIVNDFGANRLWPGETAIGKRICVHCTPDKPHNWKHVIGVVSSIPHAALDEPLKVDVYLAGRALERAQFLIVRTDRPAGEMAAAIRRVIGAIDPEQPVFLTRSMSSLIADSLSGRRFVMTLLAAFGVLALLMSMAGVYGVIAYTTSRRTQEIGVRMALGATAADVHFLIFRQGFTAVAFGIAAGLAAAVVLLSALRSAITGLEAGDPVHGIAVGVVTIAASLACWFPARRATRIDPMCALRQD
jgi:predicted permease